jgi:hypothetical protein
MAPRNLLCIAFGHKWARQRLPNRTVRLTCKRCGHIDIVERDMDLPPGAANTGGWG